MDRRLTVLVDLKDKLDGLGISGLTTRMVEVVFEKDHSLDYPAIQCKYEEFPSRRFVEFFIRNSFMPDDSSLVFRAEWWDGTKKYRIQMMESLEKIYSLVDMKCFVVGLVESFIRNRYEMMNNRY
jgi:hypothetical protein